MIAKIPIFKAKNYFLFWRIESTKLNKSFYAYMLTLCPIYTTIIQVC
jgi:hypothetical protein